MRNRNPRESIETSRRALLAGGLLGGVMGASLSWMMRSDSSVGLKVDQPLAPRPPHFPPKAKNVIFLLMAGGPSQIDLYDPKPALVAYDGKRPPDEIVQDPRFFTISKSARLCGSRFQFRRHGQSGTEISELLPKTAELADEICVVRSMVSDSVDHDPAQSLLLCGTPLLGRPTLGSWVTYGLGSEAENLPGFVALTSGVGAAAGANNWSSGFLPKDFEGVPFLPGKEPILYAGNPRGVSRDLQRSTIDTINDLNRRSLDKQLDPKIQSRINAYELAFKMQMSAPELADFSEESRETLEAYGVEGPGNVPGRYAFATNCLMARRLVERGTRFVSVIHGSWDAHKNLNSELSELCGATDQSSAALISDLRQRGLLDQTLVVWAGEFGRTATAEIERKNNSGYGRDHHADGFSLWLAGGGIRGGQVIGATDELGLRAIENQIHVNDLQATILHCLGLDHQRLTYRHEGRDFRLTDVRGRVASELLA